MSDNQHNYGSGRIRRARNDGQQAPPQSPPQQASQPRQAQPSLFDQGQSAPRQRMPQGGGSLFDYDEGAPVQPQPSGGYTEQYLSGGPQRQQSAPRTVFDYDGGASSGGRTAPPQRPSRMREEHFDVTTTRQQAGGGAPPPKRPASVFDDLEEPSGRGGWEEDDGSQEKGRGKAKARKAKKPRARGGHKKKVLVIVAVLLVFCITGVLAASHYFGELLDPGAFGRIVSNFDTPTAYSKKDVIHLLIIGIDYEEGREYRDALGLTDMILYARYDIKNNKLNMLQIPRDSYVGEQYATGGTGKINALLISGEDRNAPINNLVGPFQTMFQLPVDNYIAMDMDALKAIVDTFGGIKVFVPQTMNYAGSYLEEGWQWMDGAAAEFFVRNRHGDGFARGDIDRLDNQRHFYSALFRRFLNLTPKDVKNLLPVFDHYCNTDISLSDLISLGVAGLNLQSEDVLFAKVPGATGDLDPTGAGRSLYIVDKYGRGTEEDPGLANLLNQYFRAESDNIPAEQLGLPDISIPAGYALYPPNVQGMAEVQEPEGGSDVAVEPVA